MKPKFYQVLLMAVEDGINWGWSRAHKYDHDPSEEIIKSEMMEGVFNSLSEWFHFEDEHD